MLVYYASETTERALASSNYRALIAALEASKAPAASGALSSLRIEAATFPALVRNDIAALRDAARHLGFDLVVFTNELALASRLAVSGPDDDWRERPFLVPTALPDPVLEFSPLARPATLAAALAAVSEIAAGRNDEIVLIVKSHGSETMAVMPRVVADLSRPGTVQELLARLSARDDGTTPRADWAAPRGISKIAFWQTLAEAERRSGLRLSLVVLDACRSGLFTLEDYRRVPDGVGLIVHSGADDIAFGQIDYARALSAAAGGEGVATRLAAALEMFGLEREGPSRRVWRQLVLGVTQIPAILFFVPLALWFGWYVVRPRVRTQRARTP